MKFNNRENKCYKVFIEKEDGYVRHKEIWESRSVAVHINLFLIVDGIKYILLIKRSDKCPDEVGKLANVTGYLDWDEDATDAIRRELWEEVGLDIYKLPYLLEGSIEEPYHVNTDPKDSNRQNVTLRYRALYLSKEIPKLKISDEVEIAAFMSVDDVFHMTSINPDSFAWNHADIIKHNILNFVDK